MGDASGCRAPPEGAPRLSPAFPAPPAALDSLQARPGGFWCPASLPEFSRRHALPGLSQPPQEGARADTFVPQPGHRERWVGEDSVACWSAWPWATGLFLSMWPPVRHVTSPCQWGAAALGLSGVEYVECQEAGTRGDYEVHR